MKRYILSLFVGLSMLASTFVFLRLAPVAACPVKMPETLLSLYRNSDAIYIGRYRGSEEGRVTHDDDEYTVVEIKQHFDISSVLKGQPLKAYTAIDSDYRYKNKNEGFETLEEVQKAQFVPQTTIEDFENREEDVAKELKPGDDVLLFLRNDEESKKLEFTDYRDGVKNLPIKDITVYEARIKDLNSIFAAEKPDPEKIVDWLVRCAEDAATRWEGTYELELSFKALEYKAEIDAERKKKAAAGEDVGKEYYYYSDDSFDTGRTTLFAKLLNNYQKQTLANILLNSEFQATPKRPGQIGFVRGDIELIKLISRWADDRIAALFLNRLRSGAYTPVENSELMGTIASMLDDEQLAELAENYSDVDYKRDDIEVDESDLDELEEVKADDEDAVEPETVETTATTDYKPKSDTAEKKSGETSKTETVKKPAMTYKQLRDNLISKFLLRVDKVLANPKTSIEETNKKEER